MASKKNKKSKGVTMSLQEFSVKVGEGTGAPTPGMGQNVVYADKKQRPTIPSWADEVEEDGTFNEKEIILLPSAPRAARGPAYNDAEIPRSPPFTAHLGNLPYDISDEEIYKFFRDLDVQELKLPRDQQTNRLRGFGYVEFGTREDLIDALTKNEMMMRGRPVRVSLGTGQQDRRGGDMDRGGMRDGRRRPPAEDEDVDDWRTVMKPQGFEPEQEFRRGPPSGGGPGDYNSMPRSGGGGGGFRDRERDRGYGPPRGGRGPPPEELDFSRSQMMQGPPPGPPPQHYNTYGGRGSGQREGYQQGRNREYFDNRDRYGGGGGGGADRDQFYRGGGGGGQGGPPHHYQPSSHSRHHSESSDAEQGGTWRKERPPREHTLSQSSQSSYGPPSGSYQPPHHQRSESPPARRTSSPEYSRSSEREKDDQTPEPPQPPKERRRLVLQPRTVEKTPGQAEAGSSSIFGGAKPVDTQKREREIEEKLEKLKVDTETEPTSQESKDGESGEGSGGEGGSRTQANGQAPQRRGSRSDRDRASDRERPKQFRLLTRNSSGSNAGKDAYIDVADPFDNVKSGSSGSSSAAGARPRLPMQAPPPLHPPSFTMGRMGLMRSDEKERGSDRPFSRGGRGGGGPSMRRDDRGGRGGGSDFRRGGRGEHDGARGGGRSFDRDHRGGGGRSFGSREDFGRDRDDFRRGPHHSGHHNSNQASSLGSEERDRDSHSEPEDDRDMIRGGGERGEKGEFSDSDSDFTRVERRGRKSYNNRMSNNSNPPPPPNSNPNNNNNRPPPSRSSNFYN